MLPYTHTFMSTEVTRVDKHTALWKYKGKKQALHAPMVYIIFCNETGVCIYIHIYTHIFVYIKTSLFA